MDYNQPRQRPPMVPGPPGTQAKQVVGVYAPAGVIEHAVKEMQRDGAAPRASMVPRSAPVGNIAKAMAGIMKNVGTIPKGGFNDYYKYHYARMEDLLNVVTPLIGQHGLAIIQNEIEIKQIEGSRVAVTYEFSIFHESGEVWPEKPRFTGMSIARTRKGEWDDKAIAKCHTAARKYFLLSLFQVPAGDFDDSDEGGGADHRPVPGPKMQEQQGAVPGPKVQEQQAAAAPAIEGRPHKIVLGQGAGADQWANAYIRNIGKAKTWDDVNQFDKLNDATLQMLSDRYSQIYDMIKTAVERRLLDLRDVPSGMPDPKENAQEAMNWIASQLQTMKTYEAAEAFWNSFVAPRESDFEQLDWEMLMGEWQRTESRLSKDDPADQLGMGDPK